MDDLEAELRLQKAESSDCNEESQKEMKRPVLLHVPYVPMSNTIESGFHKSNRLCLKNIRNAMLHHQWQKMAPYLSACTQMLEDTTGCRQTISWELIWRLGTEFLRHCPNSKLEDFNTLYERLKICGVKNYAKICLEQAYYFLLNGQINDAKQQLSVTSSWRYGNQYVKQAADLKLIQAYSGFLNYLIWSSKRSTQSTEASDEANDSGSTRDMHMYFRQALVTLREVVKKPGVWDLFVLSCVDMMEFYNDEEGALSLLQNYAYNKDYPSNPNAHVYLYQYLKRHDAAPAELINALKILQCLVPSHELMLEYCPLVLNSGKKADKKGALGVIMNLLEYSCWRSDRRAWKCLQKVLKFLKNEGHDKVIKKEWDQRRDLWLALHFRRYQGKKESSENVKLQRIKTKILKKLGVYSGCYTLCDETDREENGEETITENINAE